MMVRKVYIMLVFNIVGLCSRFQKSPLNGRPQYRLKDLFKKFLCLLNVVCFVGCQGLKPPFVHKSEEELEQLDKEDWTAAQYFQMGLLSSALKLNEQLSSEMTVSRPLFDLERVSILLTLNRREEAFALMKKYVEGLNLLFSGEAEIRSTSLWHGENNKIFRGDNHERATLYSLLAMAYIEHQEYDQAISCVKNGLIADTSSLEGNHYSSDYALLHYLGYLACRYQGDDQGAAQYRQEYLSVLRGLGYDVSNSSSGYAAFVNTEKLPTAFLVVWTGFPPSYMHTGAYHEKRSLVLGSDPFAAVGLTLDEREYQVLGGLADLNFQASTRGGRLMDCVLDNKASVKGALEDKAPNVCFEISRACFQTTCSNPIGECIILGTGAFFVSVGFCCYGIGKLVNSTADIRSWKCLPAKLRILPLYLQPGVDVKMKLQGYSDWDCAFRREGTLRADGQHVLFNHISLIPAGITVNHNQYENKRARKKELEEKMKSIDWRSYEIR